MTYNMKGNGNLKARLSLCLQRVEREVYGNLRANKKPQALDFGETVLKASESWIETNYTRIISNSL